MWLNAWLKTHPEERRDIGLALLLVLEAAFIFVVVPLVEMERSLLLLHLFQAALAGVAAAAVTRSRTARVLVIATFALTLLAPIIRSGSPLAAQFLFNMVLTWIVAAAVFRTENVTHHRILGAAVVYLNIAWLFGMVYRESAALLPNAFSHPSPRLDQVLSFSLGALTTVGGSELVPAHPLVRSLASLESVVGQFFLAVLVARLMGLHLAQRTSQSNVGRK